MTVCMSAGHPLAGRHALKLADLDGQPVLVASPSGTPYTDLVTSTFEAAGAVVEPIESHVTGGAALLAELPREQAIAVMPTGTASPDGVVSIPVEGFTLPLFVLWPAGRPSEAIRRLRQAMSKT